jgi:hypothetical protein
MNERRNDLEIMNWIPQIALQIQNSDQSPLYDVRNPAPASRRTQGAKRCFADDVERSLVKAACRSSIPSGGARRDRTDDLMLAKHALSQLSYGPVPEDECFTLNERRVRSIKVVGLGRLELPTSRLSSARSNQLSYKPPTRRACSRAPT